MPSAPCPIAAMIASTIAESACTFLRRLFA